MKDQELQQLWTSYSDKLMTPDTLQHYLLNTTTDLQVKSLLGSMKTSKKAVILLGLVWVILVDSLIINTFEIASSFFTISALIQVLLTKVAIGLYGYQLVLIRQIDLSQSILATQQKLASLKASTLWIARLLFLQTPVWSTFYLHKAMFVAENTPLLIFQTIVTLILIVASGWLFWNIRPSNKGKRWFQWIFSGNEWTPIIKSMKLLDQIEEFKKS